MKLRIAQCLGICGALLGSINGNAQTSDSIPAGSQRMVVTFKPAEVAKQSVKTSDRIDAVFVDQRYQKNPKLWGALNLSTALQVRDLENLHGVKAELAFGTFSHGFAGNLTPQQVESLKADRRVQAVFPDATGQLAGWNNSPPVTYTSLGTVGWNIFAINANIASSTYRPIGGYPVKAFVLDAGVQPHIGLNFNASTSHWSFDTHGNPDPNGNSCTYHATHVAGIIGAKHYSGTQGVEGVAPGAVIWSMKIVNYCGVGNPGLVYLSSVLTAINAIDGQTGIAKVTGVSKQRLRAVANMSVLWDAVGGPLYISKAARDFLRSTMQTAVANGIFFSVAAGNSNRNAQEFYPAAVGCSFIDPADGSYMTAVPGVMAVGAIDWQGNPMNRTITIDPKKASYGPCVKIWAPGVSVPSTVAQIVSTYPSQAPDPLYPDGVYWNPFNGKAPGALGMHYYDESSGSSMAAPHIAGAALLYSKKKQYDGQPQPYPDEIQTFLLSKSSGTKIYPSSGQGWPVNIISVSGW